MSTPARQLPAPPRDRRDGAARGAAAPLQVRPASTPRERPALLVVPSHVRRRRAGVAAVLGVTAVFALMLGLVAFQAKIAQDQLRLDRMERDLDEAGDQFQQLRLKVAQLEAPERVVAEARRLGLVRPGPDQVTYLSPGPAVVAEVAAAGGVLADTGPSGTANAEDWSSMKPLLRAAP